MEVQLLKENYFQFQWLLRTLELTSDNLSSISPDPGLQYIC